MKVADALYSYFRGAGHVNHIEMLSACCAYALYKAQQIGGSNMPEIGTVLDSMKGNNNVYYLAEPLVKEHWQFIDSHYQRFTSESLAKFILFSSFTHKDKSSFIEATPASIVNLSLALLNICAGDRVADFGTGTGTFLVNAFLKNNTANYFGVELEPSMSAISSIRAELLGGSVKIEQNDMFAFAKSDGPFDKIFSNYPFGLRLKSIKNMSAGLAHLEKLSYACPEISKVTSADWVFSSLLASSITDKGKAVGVMTSGSILNSTDKPIREYFARSGFIEAIIALPDKMFSTTPIPTTLVVFSHGNKSIRMVDAREICQKGRRQNEFSEGNIAEIAYALTIDSKISKRVDLMEIEQGEYAINPMRYLEKPPEIENGRELGDIAISITRGAHFSATQLDEMSSQERTDYQFLKLSNIQDGFIDEKLPYLKEVDSRYRRYRIRSGDLLISKYGLPFKIAVADIQPNAFVIASTNIYIIRLDVRIANPHYFKAYFESEQGTAALSRITAGATLPTIGAEQLKKLIVPVPPLAVQQEFIERYIAKAEEVKQLKHRLEKTQAELKSMFGEA